MEQFKTLIELTKKDEEALVTNKIQFTPDSALAPEKPNHALQNKPNDPAEDIRKADFIR